MKCSICLWALSKYKVKVDDSRNIYYCEDCIKPIEDLLNPESIELLKEE